MQWSRIDHGSLSLIYMMYALPNCIANALIVILKPKRSSRETCTSIFYIILTSPPFTQRKSSTEAMGQTSHPRKRREAGMKKKYGGDNDDESPFLLYIDTANPSTLIANCRRSLFAYQ